MTLDEQIRQLREMEQGFRKYMDMMDMFSINNFEAEARKVNQHTADVYGRLAGWLEELKRYRDLDKRDESKEVEGKTMLQDFLEKHPKAVVGANGVPVTLCPFRLGYTDDYCKDVEADCVKCWNRPLEE